MKAPPRPDPWQEPAARTYWMVCLGALLVLAVALLARNLGAWSLLPLLAGIVSLIFRWRSGPLLIILMLGWVLYSERLGLSPLALIEFVVLSVSRLILGGRPPPWPALLTFGVGGASRLSDLVLCGAVLAYTAAHYRLLGLTVLLYPIDPGPAGKPGARPLAAGEARRSGASAPPREIVLLLALLPIWVAAAGLGWKWLADRRPPVLELPPELWRGLDPQFQPSGGRIVLELPGALWRAMLLAWALGLGGLVIAAVVGYLAQRRMSAAEAELYLQDVAWRETCREQRQLGLWLAWGRLRQRRKEKR